MKSGKEVSCDRYKEEIPLVQDFENWCIKLTLEEGLESGRVGTVVGDDDTRAADDFAGLALTVDLL